MNTKDQENNLSPIQNNQCDNYRPLLIEKNSKENENEKIECCVLSPLNEKANNAKTIDKVYIK